MVIRQRQDPGASRDEMPAHIPLQAGLRLTESRNKGRDENT